VVPSTFASRLLSSFVAVLVLAIAGCSGNFESTGSVPGQSSFGGLHGQVHGGRQPIAGATIQVYAAGTGAYGAASTPLLPVGSYYPNGTSGCTTTSDQASSVSVSSNVLTVTPFNANGFASVKAGQRITLSGFAIATYLNGETLTVTAAAPNSISAAFNYSNTGNTVDPGTVTPGCNGTPVTTDASGSFSISGDYTCTEGSQVYMYALGGNPGNTDGSVNSAAGLMAVLGQCPASQTFADTISTVIINEASTVAAAYAMAGFAVDATHVSAPSATSPAAATGIANAFANAGQLYSLPYGGGGARATTPAGNGVVPQMLINSMANSLAACVNSTGASSSQCSTLFSDARIDGTTTGTQPTDTASAAINMAHFPGTSKVGEIFGLASGIGTPYVPFLGSAPSDFVVAVQYSGGGMVKSYELAIDGTGSVWVTNESAGAQIDKLTNLGAPAPGSPFTGGGLGSPYGPAVDTNNNVWVANATNASTLSEFTSSGSPAVGSPFSGGGLSYPDAVAIDPSGDIWAANAGTGPSEFYSSGTPVSGSTFTQGGASSAYALAVDPAGNVWVANYFNYTVSELNNAGAAVGSSPFGCGGDPDLIAIDGQGRAWATNVNESTLCAIGPAGAVVTNSPFSGGGLQYPAGVAVDGSGNIWVSDISQQGVVSEFSSAGVPLSPSTGYVQGLVPAGNYFHGEDLAVDGSGDVWVTSDSTSVVELIGAATPVVTPIALGVKNNTLGARP
jgi:streptogramin lyase